MTDRPMDRHDPRRNDALGLVRRMVKAGRFKKSDVEGWGDELGADVVDQIVQEFAPQKTAKVATSKKAAPAAPDKE